MLLHLSQSTVLLEVAVDGERIAAATKSQQKLEIDCHSQAGD